MPSSPSRRGPKKPPPRPEDLRPKLIDERFGFDGLGGAKPPPPLIETADAVSTPIDSAARVKLEREREALELTILEEEAALGKESFWYFLTQILFPKVWKTHYSPDFHRDLCWGLQNLEQGEDFWVFIPREHRKSFILTIAHTAWLIVRDPNIRVLLVGAREETVKPFARVVLSIFEENTPGFEHFRLVYPEMVITGRGRTLKQVFQFTHPLRTIQLPDPTFRATYLAVSGAGWRCDILKFDDAVERRSVNTPEMSAKTTRQMMDLFPLVDTNSRYRNILGAGTRWSYHDPYGLIIGEAQETQESTELSHELSEARAKTKIFVRHALEDPHRTCEHCPPHIVARMPHGHPSMAEDAQPIAAPVHTRETILRQYVRYKMDANLGESLFWHQYMNVCIAPSAQKFKSEWFLDVDVVGFPAAKRRVLCIDSASKDFQTERRGDYMVALFGEFDDEGRLLVRHGLRSNLWTKDEFIRQIVAWCRGTNWWPRIVAKEKFGEDTFLTDMYNAFLSCMRPVHPIAVTRPPELLKKNDWITEILQGPMERGEVIWGSRVPLEIRKRAEYELTSLGQVAHEDVADTMALFFVKGIRIEALNRSPALMNNWEAPTLGLFEPGAPAMPGNLAGEVKGPFDKARNDPRVTAAIEDIGQGAAVKWDPPSMERQGFAFINFE